MKFFLTKLNISHRGGVPSIGLLLTLSFIFLIAPISTPLVAKSKLSNSTRNTIKKVSGLKKIEKLAKGSTDSKGAFITGGKLYLYSARKGADRRASKRAPTVTIKEVTDGVTKRGDFKFSPNKKRLFFNMEGSLLAVYHYDKESAVTIGSPQYFSLQLIDGGNSPLVIGLIRRRDEEGGWLKKKFLYDVYIIDSYKERVHFALQGLDRPPKLSSDGSSLYWFNREEKSWIQYPLQSGD